MDKILLQHIPKTGGTSFREIIASRADAEQLFLAYPKRDDALPLLSRQKKLERARFIIGHIDLSAPSKYGTPPLFATFLREPLERVQSQLNHIARAELSLVAAKVKAGVSLRSIAAEQGGERLNNHMVRCLISYPEGLPPIIESEEYLETAKRNIEQHYFFVGLTETLSSDCGELLEVLGLRSDSLPDLRLNAFSKSDCELHSYQAEEILGLNALDEKLYRWVLSERPNLNRRLLQRHAAKIREILEAG